MMSSDEGRLPAFVPVADELDHPADEEEAHAPGEPGGDAAAGDFVAELDQDPDRDADGDAEDDVAAGHVPGGGQGEDDPGEGQGDAEGGEGGAGQEHADAEDDHRHADEVADDVAPVAVVLRVLGQEVGGVAHGWASKRRQASC
jgi:hypothetical protein